MINIIDKHTKYHIGSFKTGTSRTRQEQKAKTTLVVMYKCSICAH